LTGSVDAIYDSVIVPTLKDLGVVVRRVDRHEHNDDIDDKILELIDICDFGIAELTYARPSVYYEAGRINGLGRPVIFMVRKDHLTPRSDDPEGNLRVHFDLQMKNIIDWTGPSNRLSQRLGTRVRLVTRPIRATLEAEAKKREATDCYRATSPTKKYEYFQRASRAALAAAGYSLLEASFPTHSVGLLCLGVKQLPAGMHMIGVLAGPSMVKRDLALLGYFPDLKGIAEARFGFGGDAFVAGGFDVLCVTLRPVPESRVHDALPSLYVVQQNELYEGERDYMSVQRVGLHTLCPQSFDDFDEQLRQHVELICERLIPADRTNE
jgi:nucleoside 2-deoxyribosyltransferase